MRINSKSICDIFVNILTRADCAPTQNKLFAVSTVQSKFTDESAINSKSKLHRKKLIEASELHYEREAVAHLHVNAKRELVFTLVNEIPSLK